LHRRHTLGITTNATTRRRRGASNHRTRPGRGAPGGADSKCVVGVVYLKKATVRRASPTPAKVHNITELSFCRKRPPCRPAAYIPHRPSTLLHIPQSTAVLTSEKTA